MIAQVIKTLLHVMFLMVYTIYSFVNLMFRKLIPRPSKSLEGEIFLITGSGSGIGREVAINLARNHVRTRLVLWDRNEKENEETAETARFFGAKAFTYTVDVTDAKHVEETAAKVIADVGDVTILFNNAGVAGFGELVEQNPKKIEQTININLTSHFWTLKAFVPRMILKNHGHIITTSSVFGWSGCRYDSPYAASKFGVRGYIEALQSELRHHPLKPTNIKFTTVYPYFIQTPMTTKVLLETRFLEFLKVKDVAESIVYAICQNEENLFLPWYTELLRFKSIVPQRLYDRIEDFFILHAGVADEDEIK